MSQQLSSTEMAQSMSETRRRQKATVTGGESTLDDDSGYTRAFQTDDQKFMLWNLANRETCPRTQRPAFRLLGLFPDMESVMSHAEQVFAVDKSCSLHASTTHEWYTIPVDPNTPVCETQAKVNRNLLKHQNMLQAHATEFKTRHDALTAGRWPADEVAQGALVLVGGALLLTPGFVTDVMGLAFVLPPTRALLAKVIRTRFREGAVRMVTFGPGGAQTSSSSTSTRTHRPPPSSPPPSSGDVLDVEVVSVERDDPDEV